MSSAKAMARIAILAFLLAAGTASANNLTVTNTSLMSPAVGKVAVRFDIAWENSWRDGMNWDAAWVFVKYSIDGGSNWAHATLAASGTNPPGFTNGTGTNLDIVVPADKKGAFIQRAANGVGAVNNTGVKLWWDFATNGVSRSKSALAKVFAVEMVCIPEGSFYLGTTNGSETGHFHDGSSSNTPFWVTNGAITVSNVAGCLWGTSSSGDSTIGPAGVLSTNFPTGYRAFYLMKTEVSQRQYCDFLNTLRPYQQSSRYSASSYFSTANRHLIKRTLSSPFTPSYFGCDANDNAGPATAVTNVNRLNETNDGEWVACGYLSWADGAAYMDWSGLRPITELEFEKACRGPLAPVTNEYAWGDPVPLATTALSNEMTAQETPTNGNARLSGTGPFRCGSYARASSGRVWAGAGYYGNLDLTGNVMERPVTVGNATGRAFTGEHGDGELTSLGEADVTAWPGANAIGAGVRGGAHYHGALCARTSDREFAAWGFASRVYDYGSFGCRAARTAP